MYDLNDKVVLITGAAKGIGAVVVDHFLEEGAKQVRILDVDEKSGLAVQDELNGKYGEDKVKFVKCDVTNQEEFYTALTDAKDDHGYIDVLINNAGVTNESTLELVRKQIEINFIAPVNGTLKAIELMRKDRGGKGGTIINIASIAGLLPICPPLFIYSSTKSGILQFSTCIGRDPCAVTGVRVMSICYGVTDTSIIGNMKCIDSSADDKVQSIVGSYPMQSTQSAARGTVEVFQKGESASIWLVQNDEPAKDLSPYLQKADTAISRVLKGLE